jgi:hypothetical protein
MPEPETPSNTVVELARRTEALADEIRGLSLESRARIRRNLPPKEAVPLLRDLRTLSSELTALIADLSQAVAGRIQISLGRSDSIAKFFAFNFIFQPWRTLESLSTEPFMGSGVYGIYYVGTSETAYAAISQTETPIYIGKADPVKDYAETTLAQGPALHFRLKEHAKSIGKGGLVLSDFRFRCATIQSGMQSAVEDFLIRLFHPIWNKEVKVCYGIGKHGDSSATRRNKRSPWDTMHPGRAWALTTSEDQIAREQIVLNILEHFTKCPPFETRAALEAALVTDEASP